MTMQVDPFEALVTLAQQNSGLADETGGRIDVMHHYGQDAGDWPLDAKSLVLTPVSGVPPILDDTVQRVGLEARCYGDTPFDAGRVYMRLVDWLRTAERVTVDVTGGTALVYYVIQTSSQRLALDDEVRPGGGMPFYGIPLRAEISELFV